MRVVLDTNILVSACWKPGGLEDTVAGLAVSGQITACVSPAILAEYREVLARPKLAAAGERAANLLAGLQRAALVVEPAVTLRVSVDDDDNRFLECAEAAAADYLITGNLRHYPEIRGNTRIVNARTFLSR